MGGEFEHPCSALGVERHAERIVERHDELEDREHEQRCERPRLLGTFAPVEFGGDGQCRAEQQLHDAYGVYRVSGDGYGIDDRGGRDHRRHAPYQDQQVVEPRADEGLPPRIANRPNIAADQRNQPAPQHAHVACPAVKPVFGQCREAEQRSPADEQFAPYVIHAAHIAVEDASDDVQRFRFGYFLLVHCVIRSYGSTCS